MMTLYCVWCGRTRYYDHDETAAPGVLCATCIDGAEPRRYLGRLVDKLHESWRATEGVPQKVVGEAARAALLFLSGLQLRDQPTAVQRRGLEVLRGLMKALGAPAHAPPPDPATTPPETAATPKGE